MEDDRYKGRAGEFVSLASDDNIAEENTRRQSFLPAKSIEGWIIIVTGVQEEAQEEDLFDAFEGFGEIKNLHLNLDRRTGFVKGYCLIEYGDRKHAETAVNEMNGRTLLGSTLHVDWAFMKTPPQRH